tara:strand:+ start:2997 stop:3908 length:912 start_codon:yes stop_codon:yes gene_type:complete
MYYLVTIPIIIFILCLILLLLFGNNWCENIFEKFSNIEIFSNQTKHPNTSQHFIEYIKSIHSDLYTIKLPNYKNNFFTEYSNSIVALPDAYKIMLQKYIEQIDIIVKDYPIFNKYKWDFMASINNLEHNMPFTLDKKIIIPIIKLKELYSSYQKGIIQKEYINTLLHEKLHVIQRHNQDKFDNFYKKKYHNFIDSKIDENIPESLLKIYMNNPDSNNSIWIYKMDGKKYIPLLVTNNNTFTSIGFNKELLSDKIDLRILQSRLGYSSSISFYHPNEIFACDVTEQLILGNLEYEYSRFLSNLF